MMLILKQQILPSYTQTLWVELKATPYLTKEDEGTIILFPSALNHIVYPHHSTDEYRISIAGDISVDSQNCLEPVMPTKQNDEITLLNNGTQRLVK